MPPFYELTPAPLTPSSIPQRPRADGFGFGNDTNRPTSTVPRSPRTDSLMPRFFAIGIAVAFAFTVVLKTKVVFRWERPTGPEQ